MRNLKIFLGGISTFIVVIISILAGIFTFKDKGFSPLDAIPKNCFITENEIYDKLEKKYLVVPVHEENIATKDFVNEMLRIRNFEVESEYPYGVYFLKHTKENDLFFIGNGILPLDVLIFERKNANEKAEIFYKSNGLKTAEQYIYEIDNTFKYGVPVCDIGKTKENIEFKSMKIPSGFDNTQELVFKFKNLKNNKIELKYAFDKQTSEDTDLVMLIIQEPFNKDLSVKIRDYTTCRVDKNNCKLENDVYTFVVLDDNLKENLVEVRFYTPEEFKKCSDYKSEAKYTSFFNRGWEGNI